MELKRRTHQSGRRAENSFYSYLYGIETSMMRQTVLLQIRFTRTFMELKLQQYSDDYNKGNRFTRTFMELKLLAHVSDILISKVLLVPLWN